jgi:hypothetical protein
MPIVYQYVGPPIIIKIEKTNASSEKTRIPSQSGLQGLIVKVHLAYVAVEAAGITCTRDIDELNA